METLQNTQRVTHKNLQKRLQADQAAYAESIGRHDKQTIADIANHASGEGTVLRLFFGATLAMPLRGLSYVLAARRIAEHIPHEQLQVIFAHDLGESINGIKREEARVQAMLIRDTCRRHFERQTGGSDNITFGEDTPTELQRTLIPVMRDIVESDPALLTSLAAKGSKHGQDFLAYGTAHVSHQETSAMSPVGLTTAEPAPIKPQRLVSIGCQQEHLFYRLRHKARTTLANPSFIPAAQIFTRHVLPPYYMARGGEQLLADALHTGVDLAQMQDTSASRDVDHLLQIIPMEEIRL